MTFIVQAITTKYIGPSNVRGSRIKAKAAAGSITIGRDDSLNIEQNHAKAAEALARKFGWHGNYFQGGSPNEDGYCFVCVDGIETRPDAAFTIAKVS
jgi:hypothetical protein